MKHSKHIFIGPNIYHDTSVDRDLKSFYLEINASVLPQNILKNK